MRYNEWRPLTRYHFTGENSSPLKEFSLLWKVIGLLSTFICSLRVAIFKTYLNYLWEDCFSCFLFHCDFFSLQIPCDHQGARLSENWNNMCNNSMKQSKLEPFLDIWSMRFSCRPCVLVWCPSNRKALVNHVDGAATRQFKLAVSLGTGHYLSPEGGGGGEED